MKGDSIRNFCPDQSIKEKERSLLNDKFCLQMRSEFAEKSKAYQSRDVISQILITGQKLDQFKFYNYRLMLGQKFVSLNEDLLFENSNLLKI